MLIKITSTQIAHGWDVIKWAIGNSLPPVAGGAEDRMSNLLKSLLLDHLQCWVSVSEEGKIQAIVVTSITIDEASGIKNLLVYCMYGFVPLTNVIWAEGLVALKKYAKHRGCHRITAYTSVPGIIDLFKRIGGNTDYTFISLKVGD